MAAMQRVAVLMLLFTVGEGLVAARLRATKSAQQAKAGRGLDEVISLLMQMMTDFRTQSAADNHAWTNYQAWAQETETDRSEYIRNQEALVMQNEALVSSKRSEVQRLTSEIAGLVSSIAETQKSLAELVAMRHEEHTQHEAALADLTKTITAVARAIQILEGHYAASGAALNEIKEQVQYALTLTGAATKKNALTTLIQKTGPDWLSTDGAAAYGTYEKQGGAGGVIGTLNELRSTLDANRQSAIETEANAVRDYEEQRGMQESTISRLQGEQAQKTTEKQEAESTIQTSTATIAVCTQNKADAQLVLTQLAADLASATTEFQTRTRTRDDEMAATQAALDALQSVSAGAKSGVSLLQILNPKLLKCARCGAEETKLRALSKSLGSNSLLQVAAELKQRAQALFDPASMDPVKTLLSNLITRLEEEASAESSHHEWCETEKTSSAAAQASREDTIKTLQGEIERFTVSVQQLKTEVEFLQSEIVRVNRENDEATANRNAAHTAFVQAEADHTEVIAAIEQAMKALSAQYGFVQVKVKAVAKVKAHHKASPFEEYSAGAGGSASEMLEDLLSRYSAALTTLRTDEENGLNAYDALMAANAQFLTDTETTVNAKIAERRGKVMQLSNQKAELTTNFVELKEIAQYLQDLRPSCDDIRSSFEERKRRREAEIAALRECLAVLSDPSSIA